MTLLPRLIAMIVGAMGLVLAVPLSLAAQDQSVLSAPTALDASAVVEELTVTGTPPGPALWRVQRGDSEVIILGGLTPLPHMLQWSSPRLDRALVGANTLLVPPQDQVRLTDLPGLALRATSLREPFGHTLEADLPPALRQRFVQTREAMGIGPGRYAHWKPAIAGFLLIADFREKQGLSTGKPATTVMRRAKALGIKIQPMADIGWGAMVKSASAMKAPAHEACLIAALNDLDAEAAHARPLAQAWAVGDLGAVRAGATANLLDQCLLQLPSATALLDRGTRQSVEAINAALSQPGKTVAVIDLKFLLRAGGVLDMLKAQGADISVPREVE
jgi:uncharacterized protein YbaP (TraB family)